MQAESTGPMQPFVYPSLDTAQRRQFETFAQMLASQGQRFNLTAILEPAAIYVKHFADALQVLDVLDAIAPGPQGSSRQRSLVDIGSGPGIPGLALAIARPRWHVTCVEATAKKMAFQQEVIAQLGLTNARAVHGRAEELGHEAAFRETFDVVTARALAPLNVLVEMALPLLIPAGRFIAYKGADCHEEMDRAQAALEQLGGRIDRTLDYTIEDLAAKVECDRTVEDNPSGPGLRLIVIAKATPTDKQYARRWRRIKRSPLGG